MQKKIAVIGGGSWATAIVKILLNNTTRMAWWVREEEIKNGIQGHGRNPLYLPDVDFDASKIFISNDIKEIVKMSDILVFVVPAAFLKDAMSALNPEDLKDKKVCSAIKGIVPQTHQIVGEFLNTEFGVPVSALSVISGPSHAEEIAQEKLTYLTAASDNDTLAEEIANIFRCGYVKTSVSKDVFGIEYATVLKNIYAVASGISKGLGYGDNFRAVLVSNALKEMNRFLDVVYQTHRSLSASVYLGDLLVTAYSQHSRNRTFGVMIGEGYSVTSAQREMQMIAEGYYAAKSMTEINQRYQVEMPIMSAVYAILYEKKSAHKEFEKLLDKLS